MKGEIFDALGNKLKKGDRVVISVGTQICVGTIIEAAPGGLLQGKTMPTGPGKPGMAIEMPDRVAIVLDPFTFTNQGMGGNLPRIPGVFKTDTPDPVVQ